jgi:hypothetical protein
MSTCTRASPFPPRPKDYVIAARDESLKDFVGRDGWRLAKGAALGEWTERNPKNLRIGDRVHVPLTTETEKQLRAYMNSVIEQANDACHVTPI